MAIQSADLGNSRHGILSSLSLAFLPLFGSGLFSGVLLSVLDYLSSTTFNKKKVVQIGTSQTSECPAFLQVAQNRRHRSHSASSRPGIKMDDNKTR
jgi:hypothetical protein